jgi:flagellin-like protein
MKNNKRGISEIIGYILMIAIVIVISIFVYGWLKSYVPQDSLTCPDGTSVSLPTIIYNCTSNSLSFSFYNDGTFSIAGYFIHATNDSTQQVASLDLSKYYSGPKGNPTGSSIIFTTYGNLQPNNLDPGKSKDVTYNIYNFSSSYRSPGIATGTIKAIEIIPIRYVEFNGKTRQASCTSAKVTLPLNCVP